MIELINGRSEAQLEAEDQRLLKISKPRPTDAEFAEALNQLAAFREGLTVKTDAVQLIRDERDWHSNRWP